MSQAAVLAKPAKTEPATTHAKLGRNPKDRTFHGAGMTGRQASRAKPRAVSKEETEMQALASLSWPEGPLTLMASDFADLECGKPAQTLQALLELCRYIDRDEVLILNLEYLSWDRSSPCVDIRRVRMLRDAVEETCHQMNVSEPGIALEERGPSVDMRISLSASH